MSHVHRTPEGFMTGEAIKDPNDNKLHYHVYKATKTESVKSKAGDAHRHIMRGKLTSINLKQLEKRKAA